MSKPPHSKQRPRTLRNNYFVDIAYGKHSASVVADPPTITSARSMVVETSTPAPPSPAPPDAPIIASSDVQLFPVTDAIAAKYIRTYERMLLRIHHSERFFMFSDTVQSLICPAVFATQMPLKHPLVFCLIALLICLIRIVLLIFYSWYSLKFENTDKESVRSAAAAATKMRWIRHVFTASEITYLTVLVVLNERGLLLLGLLNGSVVLLATTIFILSMLSDKAFIRPFVAYYEKNHVIIKSA